MVKAPDLLQSNLAITTDNRPDNSKPEILGFQTLPLLNFLRDLLAYAKGAYADPGPVTSNTVTTSPTTIAALTRQTVHITGGTVSALTFTRGAISLPLASIAGGQFIDLSPGDTLAVTFSSAPTIRTFTR